MSASVRDFQETGISTSKILQKILLDPLEEYSCTQPKAKEKEPMGPGFQKLKSDLYQLQQEDHKPKVILPQKMKGITINSN